MKRNCLVLLIPIIIFLAGCNPNSDYPLPPTSVPLEIGSSNISTILVSPEHSIILPTGFKINVFADGLQEPKMMAFGPDQKLYISEYGSGKVLRFSDQDNDGTADGNEIVVEGLIEPSGLAFFEDGSLYVAETTRIFRFTDPDGDGNYQDRETIIAGISAGGNSNRTIIFSPDWKRLFLAVGSSCNVCLEQDERRASIMLMKPDGSEPQIYARGLRYVIGLDFHPKRETLWGAVIGREGLGDNLPPEIIYTLYLETDGGWPFCHAGDIIDPDFGDKDSCTEDILQPRFSIEAHTAPHGLEFYTGSQFPEEYQDDLFIALHGSGVADSAAGYKIIRKPLGVGGSEVIQDFAVGWLQNDGTHWGTPMDLIEGPDGSLFLSDDYAGVIYRITYEGN